MKSIKTFDLKKLLKVSVPDIIGLDVGTGAVKIVQLRRQEGKYTVIAAHKRDVNESAQKEQGAELSKIQAILDCYQNSGVESRFAVCGLCGPEVAVRDFKFPALPAEEIPGAVQLEAEQVCPFNVAESTVDYQLISNDKNELRGVLVAATNKVIRQKSKIIQEASLNPVLMDIDGLALCNCFNECEKSEQGKAIAILNVGNMHTILAIVDSESIPFVRDISHSGLSIKRHLSEQLGTSPELVSQILFTDEQGRGTIDGFEAGFEQACRPLIDDVAGTIRYYTAQKKSLSVDKVLVCGGFAVAKGFTDILARHLSIEACVWNPFEKMNVKEGSNLGSFVKKYGCEMAVAAGLAMRSL